MLWYNVRRLLLSESAGNERFESSFLTASKKKLIRLFVEFRYDIRLIVKIIAAIKHNIEIMKEGPVESKYPAKADTITISDMLSVILK